MEWTQEKTLSFIKTYRKFEILWDAKHPRYYNKIQKNDAWEEIANEFETTTEECKKKMSSLLSALRREKTKIKKTRGTGTGRDELYVSGWFAFKSLLFLWDKNEMRKRKSAITDEENIEEDEGNGPVITEETETELQEGHPSPQHKQTNQTLPEQTHKAHAKKTVSPRAPLKKRKKNVYDERLDQAFRVLSNASTMSPAQQNEAQIFGNLVATKLQKYAPEVQTSVQQDIMNILFKADRGYYNITHMHQSFSIIPFQSSSPQNITSPSSV